MSPAQPPSLANDHASRAQHRALDPDELDDPRYWYSTNLVGVSSQLLASVDFNDFPQPLAIGGTRASHRGLFSLLEASCEQAAAAEVFEHCMQLAFGIGRKSSLELPPRALLEVELRQAASGLGLRHQRRSRCCAQGLGRKGTTLTPDSACPFALLRDRTQQRSALGVPHRPPS